MTIFLTLFQYGYLKVKSTKTSEFQLITNKISFIEIGNIVLGIFLDVTKADDCLDQK